MAQDGPHKAQDASKIAQAAPKIARIGASLFVSNRKTFEKHCFSIGKNDISSPELLCGLNMAQDGAEMAQDCPKIAPNQPKMLTEVVQDGPRWPS